VLRLPYAIIAQVMEHRVGVGTQSIIDFQGHLADYYSGTVENLLQAILKSPFVHVDETKISIQGLDHYVWVFTDGRHVVFRMTETREDDIVREVPSGYEGVLVSDFSPGYDGAPCRQQKCLVHTIRTQSLTRLRRRHSRCLRSLRGAFLRGAFRPRPGDGLRL